MPEGEERACMHGVNHGVVNQYMEDVCHSKISIDNQKPGLMRNKPFPDPWVGLDFALLLPELWTMIV